jgi:hypothetical protein
MRPLVVGAYGSGNLPRTAWRIFVEILDRGVVQYCSSCTKHATASEDQSQDSINILGSVLQGLVGLALNGTNSFRSAISPLQKENHRASYWIRIAQRMRYMILSGSPRAVLHMILICSWRVRAGRWNIETSSLSPRKWYSTLSWQKPKIR